MKRNTQLLLLTTVVLAVAFTAVPRVALAEEASFGIPGDWLARYTTARVVGLGGAHVATADDAFAALWNPAGLYQLSQNEIQFETARYFEDTSISGIGFVVPASRFPTLGLTVLSLNSGSFDRTDDLNVNIGEFSETDLAFLFSASKQFSDRYALGVNLKVVRQQVEDFNATGVGADIGALVNLPHGFTVGASVLNLGGPSLTLRDIGETFPLEFRGGIAYRFMHGRGVFSTEVNHREGPGATLHAGTEVWIHEKMALRVGYDASSAGGGLAYQIAHGMRFDYGVSNHELGLIHQIAISYRFGGFFAQSYATPEVFSPMGQNSVTKFNIKARTKAETSDWLLEIFDKHNERIRRFGGKGTPPAHVMWDGKNDAGLTLADGIYRYRLTVTDARGRVIRAEEKSVEILTSGPQGTVPLIVE